MTVSIALLGAGRIGQTHAQAIAATKSASLTAVFDPFAEAAQRIADQYGADIRDIETIAASDDIDAVLICTPTNTHADLIEQFARAGKAIFCEKPIDLNAERVRACLKTVEENGATLMVGFNRRFDPSFAAVEKAIRDGKIGTPEQVIITSRDPGLPHLDYLPVSGGLFRDMTIHDFDMARFLMGEEFVTVQASASVLVDKAVGELGDIDTASVIMTTATGKQCVITNSRRATYGYDQRIEVHGSKGAISALNDRPIQIELATAEGYTQAPLHDFFMTRYTAAYEAEIAAFVDAIENGTTVTANGDAGLQALLLADAAYESLKTSAVAKV